jgi:hypothetical protein
MSLFSQTASLWRETMPCGSGMGSLKREKKKTLREAVRSASILLIEEKSMGGRHTNTFTPPI